MPSFNDLSWRKHCMYGLLEVDVTDAKQFIEDYNAQTGELLSFTGYLAFCLARAVEENTAVQAYRKGRKQLVVFDDVIDGAPAARFARRLVELIESGYGLGEDLTLTATHTGGAAVRAAQVVA